MINLKLCRLIDESAIKGKRIVFFEKSVDYISEFLERYENVIDRILLIADDNGRNQGTAIIDRYEMDVVPSSELIEVDWDNTELVITSDYYEEAFLKITKFLSEKLQTVYFFLNKASATEIAYREKYEKMDLQNMIVFRSGPHSAAYVHGMDFSDNARALFAYMLQNHFNAKYTLVWFVKNPDEFAERYKEYENVKFISFDAGFSEKEEERDTYFRYLFTAKYLFFTDAYGFARNCRKDQVRVQLWHGCGFKTRTNFVRCEHRYDFTTVVSELYKEIHQQVYGLREDQVLVTGYPKEDWLFERMSENVLERLEINRRNKLLVWLPTFRKAHSCLSNLDESEITSETELPIIDTYEKMNKLNDVLIQMDSTLVIKLHPFQKKSNFDTSKLSNIILLDNEKLFAEDIQVNELLGLADALISDYSSGAVDYLILDRPIAFTLDDVKEYSDSRGFVFDNILDWLPGKEIWSEKEFYAYIEEIGKGLDVCQDKRRNIRNKMHDFSDGNSSKRVLEALKINLD